MKQQRIRAWITFLITFAMLFSFGNSYRSTAENSMPAAGEKAYSNVIESSQSLSLSDQCSILNYVDEKEFMANGFTKRVSDGEDLNTYIFERDDGTRGLYMFGEDVKFEDASGNVLEKDISLEKTYGGYTTKQNNVGLLLPDHLSDGIKMLFAGKTLTVYIADDNAVKSEKNGNSIKYINAYGDNAHLVLTPTLSGVKQDIVLDRYTWENQFDIIIFSDSLKPFYDEEGKMFFAETEFDEYRFNVGSLFVYDSAGHFTGGEVEINQIAENEWLMTLSVPQEFLASDNTIFPVTIDPKIEIKSENDSSFIEDTTVYSGKPTLATGTWPYNHTGYLSDGYNIGRMLVRTPGLYNNSTFSSIQASQICSAKFFIKETSGSAAQEVKLYAYTGTSWSENTATWNNTSPNGSYTLIDTQYPAYGAYTEYNVTNLVKGWKNGTYTASLGFMLKSTNESNVNNAKAFDASESAYSSVQPYIVVTYRPLIFLQYYSLNLNEGESCSNLAITNPTTTVQWTSSDPSIATVNSSGVITGVRASATPVTITATALDPYCQASATCTVYVKIPDGTYFIKNKATGLYAEPSGYLEGNEVYQWSFGGTPTQRWSVEYLSNGVYRIKNQMSDLYLAVESLYSTSAKATQYSIASGLSRWYISRTSSGAFCLYAKGNLPSGYVIGSALSGNTNGTSIKNMLYSSDTNYKDEWYLYSLDYSYINYYDSSLLGNTALIGKISQANTFSDFCYNSVFGVSFKNNESATFYSTAIADQCSHSTNVSCSNADCGTNCSNHHRNCYNISNQIYEPTLTHKVKTMWTNRSFETYCYDYYSGIHTPVSWIAVVFGHRPVIHFLTICGENSNEKEACMCLNLVHETAHTFGMPDVYDNPGHDVSNGYICVMEKFEAAYAFEYYQNILNGVSVPFCSTCLSSMNYYVYSSIIG